MSDLRIEVQGEKEGVAEIRLVVLRAELAKESAIKFETSKLGYGDVVEIAPCKALHSGRLPRVSRTANCSQRRLLNTPPPASSRNSLPCPLPSLKRSQAQVCETLNLSAAGRAVMVSDRVGIGLPSFRRLEV